MLINGIDISHYGAKQMKVTPGKRTVANESEMAGGLFVPVMCTPEIGLKEYEIAVAVHGDSREEIWRHTDMVVALFGRGPAAVKLDGFTSTFQLSLSGVRQEEYGPKLDRWHTLILECKGYECGKEVVRTFGSTRVIDTMENGVNEDYKFELQVELPIMQGMRPALLGIKIEQVYVVESGDVTNEYEFIGKCAPIWGELKISGVCMNRSGESLGPVEISAWGDETSIEIEKGTGIAVGDSANGWSDDMAGFTVDMPSPPVCVGSTGKYPKYQRIFFKWKFYRPPADERQGQWVRYRRIRHTLSYTPIYI